MIYTCGLFYWCDTTSFLFDFICVHFLLALNNENKKEKTLYPKLINKENI